MPLEITDEYGHWRRVEDRDGQGGWVHYSLLSGVRTVIVDGGHGRVRIKPDPQAPVNARAETGVIARARRMRCRDWCRISAGGERGWVQKTAIWGVDAEE